MIRDSLPYVKPYCDVPGLSLVLMTRGAETPRLSRVDDPKTWRLEQERLLAALRAAIRASGHTQRSIEETLEMGRGYLSQLLNGATEIKLRHVLQVCWVLGLSARELFFESLERSELLALAAARSARREAIGRATELSPQTGEVREPDLAPATAARDLVERDAAAEQRSELDRRLVALENRLGALERQLQRKAQG